MEYIERPPVRTQFIIFTLFGEYVIPRGDAIWTSHLLYLLGLLGLSERAVRSTISRMTRKGWVLNQKHGRNSLYTITKEGMDLLEGGKERIFERKRDNWDKNWQIVVYSIPEGKRHLRHILRQQLSWLGFGHLAPGTWISPHDRRETLFPILDSLNTKTHVDVFSGVYLGPGLDKQLVSQCWDMAALEGQYRAYIDRFEAEFQSCKHPPDGSPSMNPETCFKLRFWMTHEFQSFPLRDPSLPSILLPTDWIGYEAQDMFDKYHQILDRYANQFVDEVIRNSVLPQIQYGKLPLKLSV